MLCRWLYVRNRPKPTARLGKYGSSRDQKREEAARQKLESEKKETEIEKERLLRQRVLFIVESMAESNELSDKSVAVEPPVVEEKLCGTRPSMRRATAAELLVHGCPCARALTQQ